MVKYYPGYGSLGKAGNVLRLSKDDGTSIPYYREYPNGGEWTHQKGVPVNFLSVPEWKFDHRETIEKIYREWIAPELNNKPKLTTMQKLTSAIKRALSKEKQTLYKAGYLNGGLELSGDGRTAYINALFANDGDHAKAVAEMVEQAEEQLEDND